VGADGCAEARVKESAAAGAIGCHGAADAGVRAPLGGKTLPRAPRRRARAGGRKRALARTGPLARVDRNGGGGPLRPEKPFPFINKFPDFLN
jgi:hypothetical protein